MQISHSEGRLAGYNKRVPPINMLNPAQDSLVPAKVEVDLTLLKVVSMIEEDHSIEFQFEIDLRWRENRAVYQNLNNGM